MDDPIDKQTAQSVNVYPNSTDWKIKLESGFPETTPTATITFYSEDSDEQILQYYISTLSNKGWTFSGSNSLTALANGPELQKVSGSSILFLSFRRLKENSPRIYIYVSHINNAISTPSNTPRSQ